MINKVLSLLLLATLLVLPACGDTKDSKESEFSMIAEIVKIEDKIEVTVLKSPVADGPYLVITGDNTAYVNKKGKKISRDDLATGDKIRITYSGQVMMSYPPQIVAYSIQLQ